MPEDERLKDLIAAHTPAPRRHLETNLLDRLIVRARKVAGAHLYRNQVGSYKLADGRYITSGLAVGSGDLIGWKPVVVTPAMVGETIAQFVSVEAKTLRGKMSDRQVLWLERCRADGCLAVCVRSVEELEDALR
jgi:hypothetical protein